MGPLLAPSPPLPPLERREFEFGELDRWLDSADQAIRRAQRVLEGYGASTTAAAGLSRSRDPPDSPCSRARGRSTKSRHYGA
jgi:hypothetical protein